MKTMMKKTAQYWGVSTMVENQMCDEHRDFFGTFEEAAAWANQVRRA